MHPFKWSKAHAVFLPEVDAEHRGIFRMGEELQLALAAGADLERVKSLLHAVLSASEDHFSHEERIMRAASYPSFQWHKQQHDTVRKRAREYSKRIAAGEIEAAREFLEFLAHWLKDHTSLADRMMGAYVRNQQRLAAIAS